MAAIDNTTSSAQRRRRIALMLALLLACTAIAIGGSLYMQQKKAKADAVAAAEKKAESGSNTASGELAAAAEPGIPEVLAPIEEVFADAGEVSQSAPAAVMPKKRKPRIQQTAKKPADGNFAESVLTQAPAGAGTPDAPTLTSAADPAPVAAAPAAPQTPPTTQVADAGVPADPGAAPGLPPAPLPTGTGGIVSAAPILPPVTPIPEPSVWAMMAAGLGLLAAAARRRQKQ